MTREEEIINEAKKYYSDNIQCYDAFLHGTKFADEHPKNVWHDANEKPNCGSDVIALDRDNVPVYGTFKDDDDYNEYIYIVVMASVVKYLNMNMLLNGHILKTYYRKDVRNDYTRRRNNQCRTKVM